MGMTLDKIMAGARTVIETITPDVDAHILFERAPMDDELERLNFPTPAAGTRRFHVIAGVIAGSGGPSEGTWNADEINHLQDTIIVRVRYHCPVRRGGYGRLNDYISTDAHRIFHTLVNTDYPGWGGVEYRPQLIDPMGGISISQVGENDQQADTFIMNYPFRVQMILGAT